MFVICWNCHRAEIPLRGQPRRNVVSSNVQKDKISRLSPDAGTGGRAAHRDLDYEATERPRMGEK